MLAQELFDLRSQLREKGVIFAYAGYVSESVLTGVGEAVKQKLKNEDAGTTTIRSVFAVFVEQMQNIIRYSAERDPPGGVEAPEQIELRNGILTVGKEGGHYVVYAGNLIGKGDVERLRAKLSRIKAMDRDELKASYKAQLKEGPDVGSKGASVGFIEIARRATKPIDFDFVDVDGAHAFFALRASV